MNRLLILLFIFLSQNANAQNFWKFYDGGYFFDCIVTHDSNFVAVGTGITKTNRNGDTLWTSYVNTCNPNAVAEDAYGNFILAGTRIFNMSGSGNEARIAKIDSSGNLIWSFALHNSFNNYAQAKDVIVNQKGNYYITYEDNYQGNIHILEIDTAGTIIWGYQYHIIGNEYSNSISTDQDDNIYIGGNNNDSQGHYTGIVAKCDSSGNLLYSKLLLDSNFESSYIFDVKSINNKLYFIGYNSPIGLPGQEKLWIGVFDSNLNMIKNVSIDNQSRGMKIEYDPVTTDIYFLSYGSQPGDTNQNIYLFKSDLNLNSFQYKLFDSTSQEAAWSMSLIDPSHMLICGFSFGAPYKYLLVTDSSGFIPANLFLAVNNVRSDMPVKYSFKDNQLSFLSEEKIRSVTIYSLDGRLIKESLINDFRGEMDLDVEHSVYFIVFETVENKVFKSKLLN